MEVYLVYLPCMANVSAIVDRTSVGVALKSKQGAEIRGRSVIEFTVDKETFTRAALLQFASTI